MKYHTRKLIEYIKPKPKTDIEIFIDQFKQVKVIRKPIYKKPHYLKKSI